MNSSMACLSPVRDFGVAMLMVGAVFGLSGSTRLIVVGVFLDNRIGPSNDGSTP